MTNLSRHIADSFRTLRHHESIFSQENFLSLLLTAHEHDPGSLKNIWKPYLSEAALPLLHFDTLAEAEQVQPLLPPNTRIDLVIHRELEISTKALQNLPNSPVLPHLHALTYRTGFLHQNHAHTNPKKALLATLQNPSLLPLHSLCLENLMFTVQDIQTLFQSKALQNLNTLRLLRCNLTTEHLQELLENISHQKLHTLDLGYNPLDTTSFQIFSRGPALPSLKNLNLTASSPGKEDIEQLTQSPHLKTLTHLNLKDTGMTPESVIQIIQSPFLQRLTHLNLQYAFLDEAALRTLTQHKNLTHLDLSHADLNPNHLTHFAKPNAFPALKHLHLANLNVKSLHLATLSDAPFFSRLETLSLSSNATLSHDPNAYPLAQSLSAAKSLQHIHWRDCHLAGHTLQEVGTRLPGTTFNVEGNNLRAQDLGILLQHKNLVRNGTLNLTENPIGPEGAAILAQSSRLQNVHTLFLSSCELQNEGLHNLLQSSHLRSLKTLHLNDNALTSQNLESILSRISHALPSLQNLSMTYNNLGNEGLHTIARCQLPPLLRTLILFDNNASDEGVEAFAASTNLPHLKQLDLGCNMLSTPQATISKILLSTTLPHGLHICLTPEEDAHRLPLWIKTEN